MKFKCKICGIEYDNTNAFSVHIAKKHKISKIEYIRQYHKDINTYCECGKDLKYERWLIKEGVPLFSKTCGDKKCQNKIRLKNIKKTNLEKYGVEYTCEAEVVKKKIQNTFNKKYGGNPNKTKKIKDKISKIKKEKFYNNVILNNDYLIPLFSIDEYTGCKTDVLKWQCKLCNKKFNSILHQQSQFPKCTCRWNSKFRTSKPEKELQEWISSLNVKSKNNKWFNKNNKRYELDVYIPEFNLGIELNGIYWHSESQGKNKNYHLNKSKWFKDNFDIDIIHIWDLEWIEKQDIIKSIIKSKLNLNKVIYAKSTIIKEVSSNEAKMFCEINHLQGYANSSIKLGLYHKDELVALMTFSKSRFNKSFDFELVRFLNKLDHNIVGGFSKLLKYFKNNYKGSLISYVDKRYFNGQGYLKNGFSYIRDSTPNYFYTKNYNQLFNRQQFQKHKLKDKLNNFNEDLTERENMQLNGYDRIWDCGNMIMCLK